MIHASCVPARCHFSTPSSPSQRPRLVRRRAPFLISCGVLGHWLWLRCLRIKYPTQQTVEALKSHLPMTLATVALESVRAMDRELVWQVLQDLHARAIHVSVSFAMDEDTDLNAVTNGAFIHLWVSRPCLTPKREAEGECGGRLFARLLHGPVKKASVMVVDLTSSHHTDTFIHVQMMVLKGIKHWFRIPATLSSVGHVIHTPCRSPLT